MFYDITDVGRFRKNPVELATTITSMKDVMNDMDAIQDVKRSGQDRLIPISATNIAFSPTDLQKVRFSALDMRHMTFWRTQIGMRESLDDAAFARGQKVDSNDLGDPRDPSQSAEPNWIPEFKQKIDFVILITAEETFHNVFSTSNPFWESIPTRLAWGK
jgi:hypothetical protein